VRRALRLAGLALLTGSLWFAGPLDNWIGWWRFGEFVYELLQNEIP